MRLAADLSKATFSGDVTSASTLMTSALQQPRKQKKQQTTNGLSGAEKDKLVLKHSLTRKERTYQADQTVTKKSKLCCLFWRSSIILQLSIKHKFNCLQFLETIGLGCFRIYLTFHIATWKQEIHSLWNSSGETVGNLTPRFLSPQAKRLTTRPWPPLLVTIKHM